MRSILRATALFVLPTLVACLALLEVGLRLQGRLPSNVTDGIFEAHGDGYRLRPNLTKVSRTPSFECTIHTNALGLRDRAPGPRALGARPYVAFVGDSITFANGVDWDDSFVGTFGALAAPRGVEVVNLAVGGHRFSDEEERLGEFLAAAPAPPAVVVLVLTVEGMRTFEQRYSGLLVKDGYLFPREGWLLPWVTVVLGNTSSSYCFFRDGLRRLQARLLPLDPRAALRGLEPFARSGPWAAGEVPARFLARLDAVEARVRAAGALPVIVYMPTALDVRAGGLLGAAGVDASAYDLDLYLALLRGHAARRGVPLVDLGPLVRARHAQGEKLSFPGDPHYDAPTNRAIGAALYEAILGEGTTAAASLRR